MKLRTRAGAIAAVIVLAAAGVFTGLAATHTAPFSATAPASVLPSVSTYFPIAVFDQSPSGGDVQAPYTNQAEAMAAEGITVNVGENSNSEVTADLKASCANNLYLIGGNSVTAATVPTVQADAAAADSSAYPNCASNLVGYQVGDEGCSSTTPGLLAGVLAADPSRLANWGQSGGFPGAMPCASIAASSSIVSGDVYENINSYIGPAYPGVGTAPGCNVTGKQSDCTFGYGIQTARYVAAAGGKPVWVDIETGTDALGFSEAQGACNSTTNLCPEGNEQRATPEQVNSDAFEAVLNGAKGILWFCDDATSGPDACLGGGANGNASACAPTCGVAANLTYVDHTIEGFATELNSPTVSGVTAASSNASTPVEEMTKTVGGNTYLFTMANRAGGTTTATYTVAGAAGETASLIYDSATQYAPSRSEQGKTFTLNSSGQFSDTLTGDTGNAAGALSYQVKVYEISSSVTTTTVAPTTTTIAPTTTTSTSTSTTTTSTSTTTTTTTVPPVNQAVSCSGFHYANGNTIYFTCTKGFGETVTCSGVFVPSGQFVLTCKP